MFQRFLAAVVSTAILCAGLSNPASGALVTVYEDDFSSTPWSASLVNAEQVASDGDYTTHIWGAVPTYGRLANNITTGMAANRLALACYDNTTGAQYVNAWGVHVNPLGQLPFDTTYRLSVDITPASTSQGRPWDTIGIVNSLSLAENNAAFRQMMFGGRAEGARAQGRIWNGTTSTVLGITANNTWAVGATHTVTMEFDAVWVSVYLDGVVQQTLAHGLTAADFPEGFYVVLQSRGNRANQVVHQSLYDNLRVEVEAVPEPASLGLMVGGLGLVLLRRRHRQA